LTKHTYLKGRYDVTTFVSIPLTLAASSMFMIVSFNFLSRDTNKILLRAWGRFGQALEMLSSLMLTKLLGLELTYVTTLWGLLG
jgi:hypothetical protein